ncbi:MAG: right-handed parallel beta-helix repeat-containing protein, partial [Planctomycetota bacterium]
MNIWADNNWFNYLFGIKSVDTNSRVITMEGSFQARKHNRFYIMNVLALLDKPGECQISTSSGRLYVWPRKTPIGSRDITVATADHVIAVKGDEAGRVRNVHFKGLDLTLANKDVVYVTSAEDCSVRACRIENSWGRGFYVRGAATKITLADSEVRYTGFNAVEFKGLAIGQPYVNKGNLVENCHIHHCGLLLGHAASVRIEDSGGNRILHNHIHNSPRYGTSVKSLTTRFISD